jgi:pilus assembly protein FimV
MIGHGIGHDRIPDPGALPVFCFYQFNEKMPLITPTSSRLKQLSAAVMLACLLPAGAYAAALGKLTVLSGIGEPLNAEIELLSVGAQEQQSLAVALASQRAFSQANVEYNPALDALKFAIETRGTAQVVHITSAEGFNEPAVDVLLELSGGNTPRAVREYSFLLDPPHSVQSNAPQVKADPKPVPALAAKDDAQSEAKAEPKAESKSESKAESKADPKTAAKADAKAVKSSPAKGASKTADAKSGAKAKPKSKAVKSEYKVKQGESLSEIANRVRPAGVSLDQMLVAMYRANPDAFIGDNMSRMRAGAVLSVPDAATVGAVDKSEAGSVVVAQAQDFNAYRNKLAGHVAGGAAKKGGAPAQAASGKITAKVEERPTPASQAKDKLQLSKAGVGDGMTSEDKIAADKAAAEAASRIKDLEKNVNDLQKLLEIKNQNLAELNLQKEDKTKATTAANAAAAPIPAAAPAASAASAAATTVTAAAPPVATPAATPAAALEAAPTPTPAATDSAATTPAAGVPANATPATDATPPAAAGAAPAATPAPGPIPKPVLSPLVPKPDFFDGWRENPMLLPGGGLLALVILAWAAYRARRKQIVEPGDAAIGADGAPAAPVAGAEMAAEPKVEPALESVPEPEPEPAPVVVAPEEVFVPPVEEPVVDTPSVADPLFASDESAALAAAQAEVAEQKSKQDADDALKLDLSRLEQQAPAPAAAPILDMSKLGFDLELDQASPPIEDSALDIDLASELAAQRSVNPFAVSPPRESASDKAAILPSAIEGLSLDLSDSESEAAEVATAKTDNDALPAADTGEAAELAAEEEEEDDDETSSFAKEINTKLDLAAAYQEIGDKDGARELLDEVIKSGNRRQAGKAQEMLAQLK